MGKPEEETQDGEVELVEQSEEFEGDENKERGNWSNKFEFILSCTGYAVGLGNVWRFPYLCFRNGGGAFLIPYVIMLAFAGLPLFFLEVSFGQYCSQGPITCWRAVPMFRGVGYGMVILAMIVGIYYNVIIMYTIYYMFASFTSRLPWVGCGSTWNTRDCSDIVVDCLEAGGVVTSDNRCVMITNLTATARIEYNITQNGDGSFNLTNYMDPLKEMRKRPSEEYWKRSVLQEAETIGETGIILWQLLLCLLLAWIIVYLCLIKGIKSSGKDTTEQFFKPKKRSKRGCGLLSKLASVVYFTATFPYVVLVILLIRGVTLPGYFDGVLFFITPSFERLASPQVWLDAAAQIFFSLSAASGGLITLSSYNKFHNNCYVDSVLVATLNCCTSLFAGFVIFSIMGFMAHELNTTVDQVVDEGFGLAFVAYPEAVARLPISPLWSILFFVMLLTLGLDSQFTIMENVVTAVVDEIPTLRKKKSLVMFVACAIGFLLGFTCITNAGPYWVSLMDSYGSGFALLIFGLSECVALSWFYGIKRFKNDIRTMIGDGWVDFIPFAWWPINWCCITPALLSFVLMFNWMNWTEPTYNGEFPTWARSLGWMIIIGAIIWIPFIWIFEFIRTPGSTKERWEAMTNPRENWGPALAKFRLEAYQVHRRNNTTFGGRLKPETNIYRASPGVELGKVPAISADAGNTNDAFIPM